jgi:hypothetical protein
MAGSTQIQWWANGAARSTPCVTELIPNREDAIARAKVLVATPSVTDVCIWWPDHEIEHVVRRIDGNWEHVSSRTFSHPVAA